MKTVSGNCVSSKQISLSKAAKILSKFVSADNGASQVTSAYLHRASAAFYELNQLHKELKLPHSHKKKQRRHKTEETHDDSVKVVENYVRSIETNRELNHGHPQSKNEFGRQQFGSENADEDGENSTQTVVKFSQELNGSIGYDAGNGGTEKHKKNKKKQVVESRHDGDSIVNFGGSEGEGKLPITVQNETESGREHVDEDDGNMGMEDGKKQKEEKKKKKKKEDKISVQNGTESGRDPGDEGDSNMGMEEGKKQKKQKKEEEEKISVQHGTESGQEQGDEGDDNMGMEEGKRQKKEKKKKKDKEGIGDLTKKRMKRKHEDDP